MTKQLVPMTGYHLTYAEGSNSVIHPGVTLEIMTLRLPYGTDVSSAIATNLKFRYAACAEGMALFEGEAVIPRESLLLGASAK
jgi:hypothetical protein